MKQKTKQIQNGEIPEGWKIKKMEEVADFTRGFSYNGTEKNLIEGEYVFVTLNSVKEGGGFKQEFSYITSDRLKDRHFVHKGDIVIANTEQTKTGTLLGCPALVEFPIGYKKDKAVFSHHITKVVTKPEVLKDYLYYYLIFSQKGAVQYNTGSVIWALDVKNWIKNEKICLPPISKQKPIAKILSDLDAKIELNIKINKILETIGKTLFREWFLDSELNEEVELRELIKFVKGKKPEEVFDKPTDNSLPQILIDVLDGSPPKYALIKDNSVIIKLSEVLMVMDGASSGRVEIGFEGILGSTLAKIKAIDERISNYYLYYFLKERQEDIKGNTTGTSIPHADKGKIERFVLNIPDKKILAKFDEIAEQIQKKVFINKYEIVKLSQIRDGILPKLMSGEIRVK